MQLIKNIKTLSLQLFNLSKEYNKLDSPEKSVVDFTKRINENLEEEKKKHKWIFSHQERHI
jgi:hypothetical protein